MFQLSEPGQSPDPHQNKRAAGIDLGTTHSLVASVVDGKPVALAVDGAQVILPSAVHYSADGGAVGRYALLKAVDDPGNTLVSFKRWMGRGAAEVLRQEAGAGSYRFADEEGLATVLTAAGPVTAVHASADILRQLKRAAEKALGGDVDGFVITVPAYFDEAQRQATKDAARLAGVPVLRLINEPTAAALAYGLDNNEGQRILVYDLGGGTFDVSILQLNRGVFEVLSTAGDVALGGDDFDGLIADWALKQSAGEAGQALPPADRRRLLMAARQAKEALTDSETAAVPFAGTALELSRATFVEMADSLMEKTLSIVKACMQDGALQISDIDAVVLVGGSTRMPLVAERLQQMFGFAPNSELDPDCVVALGAAKQAEQLVGNRRDDDVLLLDVTPLSLGIETMGGLVDKIIQRNSPI
ncbi:Hsp70 family protein, partial [bacterium]|nr:Hsp70 family protein [bacterium]